MMQNFHLVSLGCPKNLVDSEVVYGLLEEKGWIGVDVPGDADVLLVNTCGFIQPAVEESIEEILALATHKAIDPDKKLVVIGCLVQRYRDKLTEELPEVDLFIGTEAVADIPRLLELGEGREPRAAFVPDDPFLMNARLPRSLSTPFFRAWLKITEGCDNHCAYCLIPAIRGQLRSRPIEDLAVEAQNLEARGIVELSLVAQDLTAYGRDRYGRGNLVELLKQLLGETSIPWIRLMYLYPSAISQELLDCVAENPRIVPYLDIPLQHISDGVLQRMNRRYGYADVLETIAAIRGSVAEAALRTTFLLGFPGETEHDVQQLIEFMQQVRFEHVGVFGYANEEGCAAENFPDQIEVQIVEERVSRVLACQAAISQSMMQSYVGRVETVLIEGPSPETELLIQGRTRFQAPEIDGCVLINEGETNPGELVQVEITEAQTYDLVGRIV
jgi:ribosomal protein S12 methylthiotransferase